MQLLSSKMSRSSRMSYLREKFNISRLAIKYSWLTVCIWIAVTVAGLFAFSSLKYALFPDITFPVVVINASAPLETALTTEAQLTEPLESQLESLDGLKQLRSTTYSGQTVVNLGFKVGTDLDASTTAVESALDQIDLPAESSLQVIPLNLNEAAAVSYSIQREGASLDELAETAEADIIPSIADIPGVLRVDLLGVGDREDAGAAEAPGASPNDLQNPPTLVRFSGEDVLAFQVIKRGDANTLEVVSQVEEAVQRLKAELPQVDFVLAATQANYIREATQSTIDALVVAIVIAILVIFGFLRNWRATLITALAIPISLLGTCIVMAIYGFNLETITLLALALVIGIIVDDAIVEVENIIRHIEDGSTPRQAALAATREIGLTVSASTLTIVAVFLPVALMGGTVGQFFKPFGLTVSAAVLTSLLIARTLSPALAVYWLRPSKGKKPSKNGGAVQSDLSQHNETSNGLAVVDPELDESDYHLITEAPANSMFAQGYDNLLSWSLKHRKSLIGIAIASFIAGVALIPMIPQGFIPKLDRGEFNITYTAPFPKFPDPAAQLPPVGSTDGNLDAAAGAQGLAAEQALAGAAGNAIPNPLPLILNESRQVAEELETVALRSPEVESVFTTVGVRGEPNRGKLYVKLKDNRSLTTAEVQDQLRADLPVLEGVATSVEDIQFVDTGSEKPLQIELQGDDLTVLNSTVQAIKTEVASLPGFVDVTATGEKNRIDSIVEIERHNGRRSAYVTANLSQDQVLGAATNQMVEVAESIIPPEVTINLGGDSARSNEVLGSFANTVGLSVICMLVVLFIPFKRLLEPLVVGLSLPLAIVGAMVALLVTQSDFGMASVIGLLFLLGLLDKNALLLMDYVNQLRRSGLSRNAAILKTGLVRLRPILMTTASTILGMLPLAFGLGAGAELRQPMAVAIIGGLITSSLLSLLVVPVLYTILEDFWTRTLKLFGIKGAVVK